MYLSCRPCRHASRPSSDRCERDAVCIFGRVVKRFLSLTPKGPTGSRCGSVRPLVQVRVHVRNSLTFFDHAPTGLVCITISVPAPVHIQRLCYGSLTLVVALFFCRPGEHDRRCPTVLRFDLIRCTREFLFLLFTVWNP